MVQLLIEALNEITVDYVEYTNYSGARCKHLERIFAYELYRQWANRLENPKMNPEKLILHGEIVKGFENRTKRYPDFVLHGSQGDYEHQEIVCEIKRNKGVHRKAVIGDLCKIADFFNSDKTFNHPFKLGVFIFVGGDMSRIKDLLTNLPQKIVKHSKKILIITHRGKEFFTPENDIKYLNEIL